MERRLRNALTLLLLPVAACDDPADPVPAAVADLDVGVVAPAFVQAGDSFDVEIVVRNDTDRPSARLALDFCHRPVAADDCVRTEIGTIDEVAAGGEETVAVRTALSVESVVLGAAGHAVLCIRDPHGATSCGTAPMRAGPDLEALCDPAVVSLPLTGSTIDYACSERHPLLIVIGLEAAAERAYIFDVDGVPSFRFGVYAPDGAENEQVGSRPDGKWFTSETAGRYYIAVTAPNHFAFALSDGGPFPSPR